MQIARAGYFLILPPRLNVQINFTLARFLTARFSRCCATRAKPSQDFMRISLEIIATSGDSPTISIGNWPRCWIGGLAAPDDQTSAHGLGVPFIVAPLGPIDKNDLSRPAPDRSRSPSLFAGRWKFC